MYARKSRQHHAIHHPRRKGSRRGGNFERVQNEMFGSYRGCIWTKAFEVCASSFSARGEK